MFLGKKQLFNAKTMKAFLLLIKKNSLFLFLKSIPLLISVDKSSQDKASKETMPTELILGDQ